MQAALAAPRREDVTGRLAAPLAMYRGDFLGHEQVGDWHVERREALQRLYVEGVAVYAKLLSAAGRHLDAADAYRRLIAHDSLAEEAYRGLIANLVDAGDRAEARRTYETLVRILRKELDAEPEPETTALARKLLKPTMN